MRFSILPYKKRLLYLVIAWAFFILLAYHLAIKKTILLYQTNVMVTQNMKQVQNIGKDLAQTELRLADLNTYLTPYTLDSIRNQQLIMNQISDLCKAYNLTLKHFPKAGLFNENYFSIETNIIEIEGGFANLLRLVYELETRHKIGRIASTSFKSYVDTRNKKTILSLIIYLQNVRNDEKG
jgi:hypothetical protein